MLWWVKVDWLSGVLVAVDAESGSYFLSGHFSLMLLVWAIGLAFRTLNSFFLFCFRFCCFFEGVTYHLKGIVVQSGNTVVTRDIW